MCCRKVVDLWSMQRTQYSCWESVWQVTVIRRNLMLHNKNFQHVIVRTLLTLHLQCKNIHRYTFAYLHAIRVNVPYLDIAKNFLWKCTFYDFSLVSWYGIITTSGILKILIYAVALVYWLHPLLPARGITLPVIQSLTDVWCSSTVLVVSMVAVKFLIEVPPTRILNTGRIEKNFLAVQHYLLLVTYMPVNWFFKLSVQVTIYHLFNSVQFKENANKWDIAID